MKCDECKEIKEKVYKMELVEKEEKKKHESIILRLLGKMNEDLKITKFTQRRIDKIPEHEIEDIIRKIDIISERWIHFKEILEKRKGENVK